MYICRSYSVQTYQTFEICNTLFYHIIARGLSDLVGAHSAVVGALGSREAILGPSEGVTILVQQSVLLNIVINSLSLDDTQVSHLLNSKPGLG